MTALALLSTRINPRTAVHRVDDVAKLSAGREDYTRTSTSWPIATRCTYRAIAVPVPLFLKEEGVRAPGSSTS